MGLKKPAPKGASKSSTKPAPKAGGKSASAKKANEKKGGSELEIGDVVTFVDYSTETPKDEQTFEPGADVLIVNKEKRSDGTVYTIISPADKDKYDEDADSVDGMEAVASELKKKKAGAVAKVKEPAQPQKVVAYGDLAKILKGGEAKEVAKKLVEDAKKNFFYFGGILAKIYNENMYAPKGVTWIEREHKDAWEEFCKDNYGMGAAQVRAYIDTYQTVSGLNIDAKKVGEIGWSKMAEVSRYITADNADELIEKAEELPITELKATLKTEFVDAEGRTPSGRQTRTSKMTKKTFGFQLFEDDAAGVEFILGAAQKQLGLDDPNKTFEHIINEWATDHLDESKVSKAASAVKKVQKEAKAKGVELPSKAKVKQAA